MAWPIAPIARSPVDLIDVAVRVVPFSWYASSPLLYLLRVAYKKTPGDYCH